MATQEQLPKAPYYRPVRDDGALFKCKECEELGHAKEMIYIVPTDNDEWVGVYHPHCLETRWLEQATFYPVPI